MKSTVAQQQKGMEVLTAQVRVKSQSQKSRRSVFALTGHGPFYYGTRYWTEPFDFINKMCEFGMIDAAGVRLIHMNDSVE